MHTPISAFYAGLLAIFFIYLSALVIQNRRSQKIGIGDGGNKSVLQVIRSHANFSEYVPLTLVLMLIAEINDSNVWLLHLAGVVLLFGRLFHAFGLRHHTGPSWQRVWGMLMTFFSMLLLAVLNLMVLYI